MLVYDPSGGIYMINISTSPHLIDQYVLDLESKLNDKLNAHNIVNHLLLVASSMIAYYGEKHKFCVYDVILNTDYVIDDNNDFKDIKSNDVIDKLFREIDKRREAVENIFPYFDLKNERKLFDGAAMYYLALLSYECVGPELIPTLKKAIISLRLAWLCTYIDKRCSG